MSQRFFISLRTYSLTMAAQEQLRHLPSLRSSQSRTSALKLNQAFFAQLPWTIQQLPPALSQKQRSFPLCQRSILMTASNMYQTKLIFLKM